MISGVVVALFAHRIGELLSYLVDVLLFRLRKPRREPYWFAPCGRCGWHVNDANLLVYPNEVEWQKQVYSQVNMLKSTQMSTPD